jgi:hypothetical protein
LINQEIIRDGQQALERLNAYQKQAWDDWKTTGAALLELHQEAKRIAGGKDRGRGYNSEYSRLLKRHHFGESHLTETTRICLLNIMKNPDKVEKWRNEQKDPESLNHPVYIWNEYSHTGGESLVLRTAKTIRIQKRAAKRSKVCDKILSSISKADTTHKHQTTFSNYPCRSTLAIQGTIHNRK